MYCDFLLSMKKIKMIRIKSFLPILIIVLISNSSSFAQGRKFVNEFLNIGVGAKSLAMFGAVSATANDISAGYWNPAGLLHIEAPFQVSATHSEWFAGIAQYDYLAFGKKLGKERNSFGSISLIRMGVDNIPNTFNLVGPDGRIDYAAVTQFSAADYALIISYARKAFGNLSVGGNTKIIYRQIGTFGTAWGFGFDFGTQLKFGNLSVGIMGRDITSTITTWSFNFTDDEKKVLNATGNDIPKSSVEYALPRIIAGLAYKGKFGGEQKKFSYIAEVDVNLSTDGRRHGFVKSDYIDIAPAMGFELGYLDKIYLRAGAGNLQRVLNDITGTQGAFEFQPNVGVGLKLGRLHLDYALSNVGEISSSLYSHIFSLSLDLVKRTTPTE